MGEEGKLYVGNLSYSTTEKDLREEFEKYGVVDDVIIITERGTTKSKGFGFVTFRETHDASDAIESLDQTEFYGREIKVNKAKAKERRNDSGGYHDQRSGGRSNYSGSSNSQDNRRGHRNDYDDNYH